MASEPGRPWCKKCGGYFICRKSCPTLKQPKDKPEDKDQDDAA